jgi:hypothetical protein
VPAEPVVGVAEKDTGVRAANVGPTSATTPGYVSKLHRQGTEHAKLTSSDIS